MRFHPFVFTGNAPRKGNRTPLNQINCSEERDAETGYGYLPHQTRQAHHGVRYYWGAVLIGWLSVNPSADKYPT